MNDLKTMLIIHNKKSDCNLLKSIFEGDFNLIFEKNPRKSLNILSEGKSGISIVLLYDFFNKEGYDLLHKIKAMHKLDRLPVVVAGHDGAMKDIQIAKYIGTIDTAETDPNIKEIIKKCAEEVISYEKNGKTLLENPACGAEQEYDHQNSMVIGFSKTIVCKSYFNPPKCLFSENISKYFYGYYPAYTLYNSIFTDILLKNGTITIETAKIIDEYISSLILSDGAEQNINVQIKNINGEWQWYRIEGRTEGKENNYAIFTFDNINGEILYKQKLEYQIEFDRLTGIYNKMSFFKKTHSMLVSNKNTKYVIVVWDIERFKIINDLLGSTTGDDILHNMGEFLRSHIGVNGTYGRLNGDKFVMCLPYDTLNIDEMQKIFQKKIKELSINNFELVICFGLYIINNNEEPVNIMCDRANLAQRTVKGNYMTRYAFYTENMRKKLIHEQEVINRMNHALETGEFCIFLQAQYDNISNEIIGAEALVRWAHPEMGIIKPKLFIDIFEQNGFIIKLDKFVCECACREIRSLIDRGYKPVPISLNISRIDLYNHDFCRLISDTLKKYDVPVSMINIEITESAYTENAMQLIKSIEELKSYGFSIHMDDFGSGYSSLNTLKDVPVDVLKLDMRFLSGEISTGRGCNILNSILRMAEWINIPVIAEGVENEKQADFLKNIGCSLVQGYYYSEPLSIADFESLLINNGINKSN